MGTSERELERRYEGSRWEEGASLKKAHTEEKSEEWAWRNGESCKTILMYIHMYTYTRTHTHTHTSTYV
jgi:hypothetical protein